MKPVGAQPELGSVQPVPQENIPEFGQWKGPDRLPVAELKRGNLGSQTMVRADRKKTYRKPGTAAMQKGQQARQQGNRVWKLEALGWQVTVTERLNDPETAAGRSTGRLCFYYPAAPKTPSAKKRARLERSLLPYTLAALGLPPGATTHRVRRAGCECGCSPGYSIAIPGERRRELYAEALPLEKTEQP